MFSKPNIQNAQATINLVAASANQTGPVQDGSFGRGLLVFVNVSALAGTTPSLTVTIKGVDPVSGATYTILASAAITTTGLTVLRVYPGLTAAANLTASDVIPPNFQISATIAGTGPQVTATISTQVLE